MTKRLYRSEIDKKIAGVCGGLGEYFNIDPVIIRALFAISFFVYGTGLLAYIVLWIIVPSAYHTNYTKHFNPDSGKEEAHSFDEVPEPAHESRSHYVFGLILVAVGLIWVMTNILPDFDIEFLFPVALIALGVYLFTRGAETRRNSKGELK